jgi:hypothetical protein
MVFATHGGSGGWIFFLSWKKFRRPRHDLGTQHGLWTLPTWQFPVFPLRYLPPFLVAVLILIYSIVQIILSVPHISLTIPVPIVGCQRQQVANFFERKFGPSTLLFIVMEIHLQSTLVLSISFHLTQRIVVKLV